MRVGPAVIVRARRGVPLTASGMTARMATAAAYDERITGGRDAAVSDDRADETRPERRARKRREMQTHGANLAQIYRNAVLKRAEALKKRRRQRI